MPEKIGLVAELDLIKFSRAVSTYLSKVNQMQTATQNLAATVSGSFSALSNQVTNSLGNISNSISALRTQVGSLNRTLSSRASLSGFISQLGNLTTAADKAASSLRNLNAKSTGGNISSINLGGVGSALGGLGAGIGSAAGGILGGVAGIGQAMASLAGGVGRAISSIVSSVSGLAGAVVRAFSSIIGSIAGVIRAFASLAGTIINVVGSIIRSLSSLVSGVIRAFSSLVSSVLRIVGSLATTIGIAFNTILRTVLNIVGNLVSSVIRGFTSLVSGVLNIVGNLVGGIVNAFSSLVGNVLGVVQGLASGLINLFSGILRSLSRIVSTIASTILSIFSSIAKSVVAVISSMASSVLGIVTGLVKKVADSLRSMASSILDAYRDLGSQLTRIITIATAAVVAAVVLAGKKISNWLADAITAAATFEQDMADIASVLRFTRQQVQPLADEIDKLALDPMLVVSTQEASDVIEQLSRNGLEMTQILEGAAESAILLANATGGQFAQAADVATMAMQMFGIQATEINRIADVSQGVINNSRIELEDWALALGNGGAAASASGVSFEDFATIIAGTVNLFHTARQAGTGAMNFLQRLVPITQVAADEMRELGLFTGLSEEEFADISQEIQETAQRIAELDPRLVHYDELVEAHTKHLASLKGQLVQGTNAFFDANGAMKDGADVSEILAKATKHLSEEERIESFRRIFGNDALETAIGLADMGAEAFNKLQKEIAISGSSAEAAAVRTAVLVARWRNLNDIWLAIQRKSGAGFNDMLLNLVNRMTALTNVNQERIIGFFGRMAELVNRLVEAAIPWVEKQLPAIINNLEAFASWLVETVLQGDKAQYWFDKMSPSLRGFMERVFGVVNAMKSFGRLILDTIGYLNKTFRPFFDFMLQNVELKDILIAAAGAILLNLVPGILRLVGVALLAVKAVSAIRKGWETNWGGIRSFFEKTWPKIQGPLVNFINNLLVGKWGQAWRDAVDVVTTALNELQRHLPTFFTPFTSLITNVLQGKWKKAWEDVKKIAINSFALIKSLLADLNTPFTDFILNVLYGDWGRVWQQIVNVARFAFGQIKELLRDVNIPFTDFIINLLEGRWLDAWEQIRNVAQFVFTWIKDSLADLNTPFTRFILDILEGRWYTAWRTVRQIVVEAFNTIVDKLAELNNPFTNFIVSLIRGEWFKAWEDFKEIARLVLEGVKFALEELNLPFTNFILNILEGDWGRAWEQVKNVAVTAFEILKIALRDFNTPFTDFIVNILEGKWGAAWQQTKNVIISVRDFIVEWLNSLGSPFSDFVADVLVGDWGKAWEDAKKATLIVRDFIVEWLEGLDSPFADFIVDILKGDWGAAWGKATEVVGNLFTDIKQRLLDLPGNFGDFIVSVLEGRWKTAWEIAKEKANETYDSIVAWLKELDSPFGNFVTDILEGRWGKAWKTAWDFLFGIDGLFPKIGVELVALDTPFSRFIGNLLQGKWATAWQEAKDILFKEPDGLFPKFLDWVEIKSKPIKDWFETHMPKATEAAKVGFNNVRTAYDEFIATATKPETTTALDNLASIVIKGLETALVGLFKAGEVLVLFFQGDWENGWVKAGEAVGAFSKLPVLVAVVTWFGATFPDAADKFLEKMPAIAAAWQPVADKWPETWKTISTWWEETAKPTLDIMLGDTANFLLDIVATMGLVVQAWQVMLSEATNEEKFAELTRLANEAMALAADSIGFEMEKNREDLTDIASATGLAINQALIDELSKADLTVPGIISWSKGLQGAMTEEQAKLKLQAEELARQVNDGFSTKLMDPNSTVQSSIQAWADMIEAKAKEGLEEKSPSRVFMRIADYALQGFQIQWDKGMSNVRSQIQSSMASLEAINPILNTNLNQQLALATAPRMMNTSYSTTNAPMQFGPNYISTPFDMAEFEYRVEQIIDRKVQ